MENFDQIFTLLAEHEGIGLNTDILETGLINIFALLAILIYTGRDFLGSLLEERKTMIVKGVQDAEDRLNEAQKRLTEAEKPHGRSIVAALQSIQRGARKAPVSSSSPIIPRQAGA